MSGTTSPSVKAAQTYERIKRIRSECEAELAGAPENIRAKHAKREQREREKLDGEAREALERLLAE